MIRSLVVDSSFVIRAVLPGPLRERVKALLAGWQARGDTIQVPALWYYEITSVLSKGVYFKEFNRVQAEEMLVLIAEFDFAVVVPDATQIQRAFDWTIRLQRGGLRQLLPGAGRDNERWPVDGRRAAVRCDPIARALGALGG